MWVLVAVFFVVTVSARYNLKGSTYRYDMQGNSSFALLADDEQYLRQTVTRTARVTVSSSGGGGGGSRGSGSHRSSSGRSHGGGGRRF